ncbi:MAG: aspartate-semialdehyde dehydrogenase [Thermoplasmata archaeon]|nr:aspartate-semialdehyde dehydrogenase [Thermoplasmata archaeon]
MDRIPAALFGASGMVGQRFVASLQDHPQVDLVAVYSSERSKGKKLSEIWKLPDAVLNDDIASMKLEKLDIQDAVKQKAKIAFCALPADLAKKVEPDAASAGLAVFSNAAAYRMDDLTPILIPEINYDHIKIVELQRKKKGTRGFIVTNANCSVTGLSVALKPLVDKYEFPRVFVSTYQAISGAGYPGVPSLDINANCIPFIKNEEVKMNREAKKILGRFDGTSIRPIDIDIFANCVRIPSRDGHLEAVTIQFAGKAPNADEITETFARFEGKPQILKLPTAPKRPIIVRNEENRPQPILDALAGSSDRTKGMAVTVGRIRVDGDVLRFFCLVHNTIRGSAGGSVLNAECAIHEGMI